MKPVVTILTPVYNGGKTIGKSIQTLIGQSFKNWQMVIINDGSTDNTLKVIQGFNDERIKVINLPENKGRPYARQKALEQVDTKYFGFLDADDAYYPDKLEKQIEFMERNPQYHLLSNAIGMIDEQGKLIGVLSKPEGEYIFHKYHLYQKVPHASSIVRTASIDNVSYDMTLKYTQDQDFLRRLLINKKYYFQDKINYIYTREDSFSFKKYKESLRLENKSLKKLDADFIRSFKRTCLAHLKITMVFFLNILHLDKLYFKKIGTPPSHHQIAEYEKNINI